MADHHLENNCAPDEGGLSRPERDNGGANSPTATRGASPVAPAEAIKSDAPTPDTKAAVEFLERWRPGGPWVLTSITVAKKTTTRTFGAATKDAMIDWLNKRQGVENCYFMVNPARRELTNKAQKSDVEALAWLHIDIDPRVGEDPAAEKARGERLLRNFSPPPTVIVDSGGGVQGFWRLEEPVVFGGDVSRAEELEAYNQQLEILFGGDHCHNVDRIMRLPGTINVPDEKKRKKGRVPALASVIEFTDASYPLKAFTPAARVQTKEGGLGSNTGIKISGNLPRLGSVDDLPETVTQRTKMLIVQGNDPDDPTKYQSRSEVLFAVCCELVRAGCSDDTIAAVILDPDFGISASVLDKPRPERYAARQIEQARSVAAKDVGWDPVDKQGSPRRSYGNTRLAIQRLGIVCEHDEFTDQLYVGGHAIQEWQGELSDYACAMLRQLILDQFGFDPGKDHTRDAAVQLCIENKRHPLREYLASLRWDGQRRVESWMHTYLSAADTPLNRAIGRLVLIAAVRRIRQPGCKFDNILILEGPQGTGKSTALGILAGVKYHSDEALLDLKDKERVEQLHGIWIYELGELEGLKKIDLNKLKSFASRLVDRCRPAYGRFVVSRPRQCIMIGTTNEDQYLRDPTGNRRFWPVRTGEINLEALQRDRDQLWAEAALAEAEGESLVLAKDLWGDAAREQATRMEDEPWLDLLANVSGVECRNDEGATVARVFAQYILREVLHIPAERATTGIYKRLRRAMVSLGWAAPDRPLRIGGDVSRGYERRATAADRSPY